MRYESFDLFSELGDSHLLFDDDFANFDTDIWDEATAGSWAAKDSEITPAVFACRSKVTLPADFVVELSFKVTGSPEKVGSIGVAFDVVDDRDKFVFLGTHHGEHCLTLRTRRGGNNSNRHDDCDREYTLEHAEMYRLRIAVRDDLINVAVNGQHQIAHQLADMERECGKLKLLAFDAPPKFHSIRVCRLDPAIELAAALSPEQRKSLSDAEKQFWLALSTFDVPTMRRLLATDASLAKRNYDPSDADGGYPLAVASERGSYGIVKLLLEHGADVDKPPQQYCCSCIQRAVENANYEVANLLLDHGASVDAFPDANQPMIERLYTSAVIDGAPPELLRHGFRKYLDPDRDPADLPDVEISTAPASVRLFARMLSMGAECKFASLIRHEQYDLLEELFRTCPEKCDAIVGLSSWYGYPKVQQLRIAINPELVTPDASMDAIDAACRSHNRDGSYTDYRQIIQMHLQRLKDQGQLEEFKRKFPALYVLSDNYCWHANYGYKNGVSKVDDVIGLAQLFLDYGFDIDHRDKETNLSGLAKAILRGQPVPGWTRYIEFLLSRGADLCESDPPETNPFDIAQRTKFYDDRPAEERSQIIDILNKARDGK